MANVLFDVNVRNVTVRLTLISTDTIPRAFYVDLEAIGTDCVQSERAVVVINAAGTQSDLYRHYFNALGSSVSSLTSIANDLQTKLSEGKISGTDSTLSTIMKYTIEEIIDTVVQSGSSYPQSLQTAMATIFDLIIRNNTYSGQFKYLITLKSFAHSLLTGKSCDETSVTISEVSYIIRSTRYRPTSLRGLTLSGGGRDYIRLPNTSSLVIAADCIDLHFIEFSNPSLYSTPVLASKVMVLSLQNPSTSTLTTPITYRVYSTNGDVFPSDNNCLIWQYPTGDSGVGYWDSSVCTLAQTSILEQDHVECQCRSVGDYSVAIPPSYGWTIPGPISCGFVVLVMILVILLHVIYFRRIQLGTRIFIFLCVSIAIFQLLALVDMVIGPNVSINGCVALGVLVQFAIISVFTWMFILVVSLWMNLMGFTDGREPLIVYIFVSWGLAFAIIIATILIGLYGLSWQWSQLYGKVGELCFMPSAGAAGISTAVPILLALLVGVGMLSHSCFHWSRWEDIKSLYKDTYNKREIPLLLVFLSLVVITTVFGALHLYLQEIYLFFLFFGFNVLQGIYAIVVYIGTSWHTLTWKHKHYHIKEEVEPISIPEEPDFLSENTPSMYGSQQSLIPRSQSLMTDQRLESQVQMTAPIEMSPLRTATVSSHSSHRHERQRQKGSQRGQSPPPLEDVPEEKGGDSDSEGAGSYAIAPDSDAETESHMDDLMFALKTGITYSQDDADSQPLIHEMESLPRKKPSASEQYRLRRISIADTHL